MPYLVDTNVLLRFYHPVLTPAPQIGQIPRLTLELTSVPQSGHVPCWQNPQSGPLPLGYSSRAT